MKYTNIIFETPFPIYAIRVLGERHLLVAGGGGQAKTGVPNHLEIFLFDVHENSWDFLRVVQYNTGILATMNMDIFPLERESGTYLIACGQEGTCHVYKTKYDLAGLLNGQLISSSPPSQSQSQSQLSNRRRNRSSSSSSSSLARQNSNKLFDQPGVIKKLGFSVEELKSFQSDFLSNTKPNSAGSFQKVVRFHPSGNYLITGGADGHFRVWEWPSCRKILDHNAHKDEVDDLDISPDGNRIITVGRDGNGFVWQFKDATKIADLTNFDVTFAKPQTVQNSKPIKYRYRFSRFLPPANAPSKWNVFFTCSIPIVRNAKKQSCYLSRWLLSVNDNKCIQDLVKLAPTNGEIVSTLAISDNGAYIGLGTLAGSVIVVDTAELKALKKWTAAHGIFVTSVDFLPTKISNSSSFNPLVSNSLCSLISSSALNDCQLHTLPRKETSNNSLFFIIIILIFFYYVFEFFGL